MPQRIGVDISSIAEESPMMTSGPSRTYERLLRPLLFQLDAETAHRLGQFALQWQLPWSLLPARDGGDRLAVTVGDWHLDSPIGLAAGFDKNGDALPGLQHLGFGYLTVGSILPQPSAGSCRNGGGFGRSIKNE